MLVVPDVFINPIAVVELFRVHPLGPIEVQLAGETSAVKIAEL
jgi:hypothetical protein